MRYIQAELNESEFLRLKSYCLFSNKSLKDTLREIIVDFLNKINLTQDEIQKGEVENG